MKFFFIPIMIAFSLTAVGAQTIEKEVVISSPKDGESRYYYVPFDVPEGTTSLTVSYRYDKKDGANVLDLGLFDSRNSGAETDLSGIRGWSGGRRQTVFISRESASNGYLPGEIPVGKWRVIFGLYKVVPEGVKVDVSIRLNSIDETAEADKNNEDAKVFEFPKTARTSPSKNRGLTWFRGDLHTHTFHSDGNWTLKSVLDYSFANNLDFVALTEHNTKSHHIELDKLRSSFPDLLVMTGEEVTTYGGHINVWGLPSGTLVDFRVTPRDAKRLSQVLETARQLKIPASINHPTAICGGCGWTYSDDWAGMDSVEIWNGSWDALDEAALKKWDGLLQRGSRITAIGSSDSHTPPTEPNNYGTNLAIGSPTTFIGAKERDQKSLLDAIFARRVYVTDRPDRVLFLTSGKTQIGGEVSLRAGKKAIFSTSALNFPPSSRIVLISDGNVLKTLPMPDGKLIAGPDFAFEKDTYVRVEVRDTSDKLLAFTNPIFINLK